MIILHLYILASAARAGYLYGKDGYSKIDLNWIDLVALTIRGIGWPLVIARLLTNK